MGGWQMAERQLIGELMDRPELESRRHYRALRGLERINRLSGAGRAFWGPLSKRAAGGRQPLRVLDVATGGGDVPLALWQRSVRRGVPLELAGCDLSPRAIQYARDRAARAEAPIRFFALDVLREPLPEEYDVITASLFMHHLTDEEAERFLREASRAAQRQVLVSDLCRSRAGLIVAHLVTRLVTRSDVVHVDGPRSVRAAFRIDEVRRVAQRAGMGAARVERHWPFRWMLSWSRP